MRAGPCVWWFEWELSPEKAQALEHWFPIGDTLWGGLGGIALLGEMHH